MPPMRKPFMSPTSSAAGDAMQPGMPMPPQAGRTGPQPQMPMGGKPVGDPMTQPMGDPAAAAPAVGMPGAASPGGPTSPLNIGQMLQARMGDRSAAPQQPMQQSNGSTPGAPAMADGMPAWGDQGTRPSGPARVPYSGAMTPNDGGGAPTTDVMSNSHNGAMMLQLLRTMGRI